MATKSISVTQLIDKCLADPAPPKAGEFPVYGRKFHKVAEDFVGWLTANPTTHLTDEKGLWHELYDRFAQGHLNDIIDKDNHIDSAYHLGQALKAFCSRLLQLRTRTPAFNSWRDVFFTQEYALSKVRFDIGKGAVLISGRMDVVRSHPKYGLEVIDYKLSKGVNFKHDILQLAIYARLLAITKPGLKFHASLEYYLPDLQVVDVKPKDLRDIFNDIVEPVLYDLVGEQRSSIKKKHTPDNRDSEDLSEGIKKCYADFKLNIEIIGKQDAPQLVRYMVRPDAGVKVDSLVKRARDLQVQLSLKKPPLIESAQGFVTIDVLKERPDTVFWADVLQRPEYVANPSAVAFPLGIGVDNQVLIADLADPLNCHLLVAGSTGSGKSEFLRCLVASLIKRNTPQTLRFSIVDPKKVTFASNGSDLSKSAYLLQPIIHDIDATIDCLQGAVDDMEARYGLLAKATGDNLTYHVIIMDEFGDIVLSASKEQQRQFETLVVRLAAKGRACGIALVLATQRPDVKIVTGLIKANLPLKVCLKVTTSKNSQIVLDATGGEVLRGYGDMLCERGSGLERAQSPLITQEEFAAIAG
ncbi:Cell division protein FtsK [Candidatus Magnetobacterium bavaricum]|uniref:Cell division protein FtsK n=1 Tax=Candidatus Magnetobacterium bavaricum TaxID=29290 RepID=A0A0F3GQJ3_9BACT|nr:Cell division protein FtsK [Candidatus Magnetobacterium bavaricum]